MPNPTPSASRSQRLNQVTHAPHERLDKAVKANAPFETLGSYARFVVAQYLFQAELKALYTDPELIRIFPDLPGRCRAGQAMADLGDLNTDIPAPVSGALQNPTKAQALGWLFVSEGSKLGAAFLIKRAAALNLSNTFGARHLGEPAGAPKAGRPSRASSTARCSAQKRKRRPNKAPSRHSIASMFCCSTRTPQRSQPKWPPPEIRPGLLSWPGFYDSHIPHRPLTRP